MQQLDGIRQKVFLDRYALKNEEGNLTEQSPEETWRRVARGIAASEKKKAQAYWEEQFYRVMEDFKFVPAGRILSGAGTGYQVTYFNCFVIPSPKDSRHGILEALGQLVEIQARSGGVGLNLSSLRPKGARVRKVNGTSSGPVNWATLFSVATHDIVQQGGCFAGDTRIMTHKGLISIAEIVASKSNYYAGTHEGYKKITTKFDNGIKDVYEVKTAAGFTVKTTSEHRFVTFDKNGRFFLKPLADFQEGEQVVSLLGEWSDELPYVLLNTNLPAPSKYSYGLKTITLPEVLNEDLAFIIGAYDADGSRIPDEFSPNGKGIRIAMADNRPQDIQKVCEAIYRCFNVAPKLRKGDGAVTIVQVSSRKLNEFLKKNGLLKEYSMNVKVPEYIFTSPRNVVQAYIAGVFLGDGTNLGGKGGLRIATVSHEFAQGLQLLLVNLGIPSKIKVQQRQEENWRTLYTVTVNGATFMKRFSTMLSPYNEKVLDMPISVRDVSFGWPFNVVERFTYVPHFQRTQARTNATTSQKSVLFLQQMTPVLQAIDKQDVAMLGSCVADTIASIKHLGKEQVYDLEVADVHLLSGNGFYTSNSRRGATMLMLWDWHPDIEEFITVKEDLTKINGANLSVCISDAFMEAVKQDKDWDLQYPEITDPEYDEKWDGDIFAWKEMGKKVVVYKTIKARYLWDLICTAAWKSAEPGLHFLERSNKQSNTWYFEKLLATNPSLRAGTRVLTKSGIFPIEQLEGQSFSVKNLNGQWSPAKCFLSGKNKALYKLTLNNGKEIYATAEHKWPVLAVGGGFGKVTTDKLQAGNILPFPKAADIDFNPTNTFSREEGFMLGWLYGDGWISERGSRSIQLAKLQAAFATNDWSQAKYRNYVSQATYPGNVHEPRLRMHDANMLRDAYDVYADGAKKKVFGFLFSEEDKVLAGPILSEVNKLKKETSTLKRAKNNTYTIQTTARDFAENVAKIYGVDKKENGLPVSVWQSGTEFIKGFVDGLISSDGFVAKNANRIVFTTKNKKMAEDVSSLLSFYGIKSNIRKSEATKVQFPNHKEYSKIYERYDVSIDGYHAVNFGKLFTLSHKRKQQNLQRIVNEYKQSRALPDEGVIRIQSIEKTTLQEDVWDISVYDDTHCFYINHCVTGNCGEQPLGGWAVCNLGAMNLSEYVKGYTVDTAGKFDFESFAKDVKVAMRFLDNVIDQTYYFFEQNEENAKNIRRTGLGIMGLGDTLIKMRLKYGSEEATPTVNKIFEVLRNSAYDASADLAKEKGAFPKFEKEKYMQGYNIKKLPKKLQEKVAEQGIRNAVLLTIAPTGTTSLVAGVSSGIEPVYEFAFKRKWRGGEQMMYHPLYEEWKNLHDGEEKPEYFASANDLTPLEHASVQAIAQEYIDSSISKTVNAPNNHTVDDVKTLYMLAYDMGLKGVTYMRDGSRMGVLERVDTKKPEVKAEEVKPVVPVTPRVPRPMVLQGTTYKTESPVGKMYITINHDENEQPFEVFINNGKSGSDVMAMADALGRMISFVLRIHSPVPARERMREIVSELTGLGGARSVGFGENRVRSLPDAVAKALAKHCNFRVNGKVEDRAVIQALAAVVEETTTTVNGHATEAASEGQMAMLQEVAQQPVMEASSTGLFDICPECGSGTLAYQEGCQKCLACGHSLC